MTEQIHHSVEKALRVAGLRACVKRFIAVDEGYRMNADALEAAVRADRQAGLTPWLIIASAGTTNTGAIDPLPVLAQLAQAHNLWLHVDGAYGAFFALCEEGERKLAGMEQSDSIIIDPHKTLFLPYGTGAVLVKDTQKLIHSFQAHADYMQDTLQALDEISPTDVSPELTKHFRGLRLWLPLKLLGVAPFRAALAEKLLLTQYFHHKIQEVEGFNVGPYPDLAVSTFWYVPQRGDANAFNERLAHEIQRDGRIFISTTKLGRQFVLRIAVGVHRTHLDDIEQTLAILSEKAKQLEADG
jgi:aromatic-L-amino-acid decarboxylase